MWHRSLLCTLKQKNGCKTNLPFRAKFLYEQVVNQGIIVHSTVGVWVVLIDHWRREPSKSRWPLLHSKGPRGLSIHYVMHVTSDTRPSYFSVYNIENAGVASMGTRLHLVIKIVMAEPTDSHNHLPRNFLLVSSGKLWNVSQKCWMVGSCLE